MKKHVLIEAILILTILGCSFWNIQKQQENVSLRESVANQDEKQKELKQKQEKLLQENEHLTDEAVECSESLMEMQKADVEAKTGTDKNSNSDFINVVTKLFEANLNFNPENYADKKKEVASYLTEELSKEYFGQKRSTYQDTNGTSSKLETLEVYTKKLTNSYLKGVVVVNFKSKFIGQGWTNNKNIFELSYDLKTKKISKISNLGSVYLNEKNGE
ncbi:MAG: hypothetical protein ACLTQU_07160 [Enterococcus casseliflavus]